VATEHDLFKNMGDVDVYTEFEMLKVKVPIIFHGTVGFSLPREGRYSLRSSITVSHVAQYEKGM
jgi:hypothetical protein